MYVYIDVDVYLGTNIFNYMFKLFYTCVQLLFFVVFHLAFLVWVSAGNFRNQVNEVVSAILILNQCHELMYNFTAEISPKFFKQRNCTLKNCWEKCQYLMQPTRSPHMW